MQTPDDPVSAARSPIADATPPAGDKQEGVLWQACLAGDKETFQRLVSSHLDELFAAASRDIRFHRALGDLGGDEPTPEDLVAETLLRAWQDRRRRPDWLELRPWLLGLQFRVLTRLVRQEKLLRQLTAVSLDAPLPPDPVYDDDESFWEWYQPDEALRWEDVVPGAFDTKMLPLVDSRQTALSAEAHQVLAFRFEHRFSVNQTAAGLGLSTSRVAELLREGLDAINGPGR